EQGSLVQAGVVKYGQFVTVKPGELTGMVLYPDGKTPAANVAVRVWDVQKGRFVCDLRTDKAGLYKLPKLAPGRYFVVFGDRVNVILDVVAGTESSIDTLNVLIPRGKTVFARMGPEQRSAVLTVLAQTEDKDEGAAEGAAEEGAKRKVLGLPLKTVVLGVGGLATAVGVVSVVSDDDEGDKTTRVIVSP
ncbi:MAG: carboxypeptidase regulatory-like domain-containing protein, partial [Candidatus Brocadiae bacterium]|nr:carboxypeptidase regulatory-like domain-containing protein [Candidatus Brocadiia bacterium]